MVKNYEITSEHLATEFLRLKNSLERTYRIALSMAEDKDYNNRLEALQIKDNARIEIVQLLLQGPGLTPASNPNPIKIEPVHQGATEI